MTQEEKDLLIKGLCARLPYGVKVSAIYEHTGTWHNGEMTGIDVTENEDGPSFQIEFDKPIPFAGWAGIEEIKPYLRPLSSMTDEELFIIEGNCTQLKDGNWLYECTDEITTLLNSHHFDYRGLIEKGLALEAPKDMYKID